MLLRPFVAFGFRRKKRLFRRSLLGMQLRIAFVAYFPIIDSYVNQCLAYKTSLE